MSNKKKTHKECEEFIEEIEPQEGKEPEEVREGKKETETAQDQYLRLLADFQNYKRRSEKEKNEIYSYANEKILSELIAVIDDFERALSHETDASSNYVEGMNMIYKNFKAVLEKAGLSEINALGAEFDPNYHNAVMTSADSGYESGKICNVIQKGYMLNNKVIRPSMVKVAE